MLDDRAALAAGDPHGAREVLAAFPAQCRTAVSIEAGALPPMKRPRVVVARRRGVVLHEAGRRLRRARVAGRVVPAGRGDRRRDADAQGAAGQHDGEQPARHGGWGHVVLLTGRMHVPSRWRAVRLLRISAKGGTACEAAVQRRCAVAIPL